MKKTTWFDGSVKPVRDGVYERKHKRWIRYSKFYKGSWRYTNDTVEFAASEKSPSMWQNLPWRGITKGTYDKL